MPNDSRQVAFGAVHAADWEANYARVLSQKFIVILFEPSYRNEVLLCALAERHRPCAWQIGLFILQITL